MANFIFCFLLFFFLRSCKGGNYFNLLQGTEGGRERRVSRVNSLPFPPFLYYCTSVSLSSFLPLLLCSLSLHQ
jgi:hypothetical protein